jgi:hypothetical protein
MIGNGVVLDPWHLNAMNREARRAGRCINTAKPAIAEIAR